VKGRVRLRGLALFIIVVCFLPPLASANVSRLDTGSISPSSFAPCVTLNLTLEQLPPASGGTLWVNASSHNLDIPCFPSARLEWNANLTGGHGTISFDIDANDVTNSTTHVGLASATTRPRPISLITELLDKFEAPSPKVLEGHIRPPPSETRASGSDALPRFLIVVSFDVAWGGSCQDAHGTIDYRVNDAPRHAQTPPKFFHGLCVLSTRPSDALVPRAADALATLALGLVPSVPASRFSAFAASLALPALVTALEAHVTTGSTPILHASAPAIIIGSDHPSEELRPSDPTRAVGNATLVLFDPRSLVYESHDATVTASGARLEARGDEQVTLPAAPPKQQISRAVAPKASSERDWRAPEQGKTSLIGPVGSSSQGPRERSLVDGRPPPPATRLAQSHARVLQPPPRAVVRALVLVATSAAALAAAILALYPRITKPKALENEARHALLQACNTHKRAMTAGELARLTGLRRQAAEYHLRYLARLQLVRVERAPGTPIRYATHLAPKATFETPLLLSDVLARVHASPGATTRELADAFGARRPRLDRRLKDLLLDGLIESRVEDGSRRHYPAAEARLEQP
jgi:DNA-binding transcriptional ArsR family regulator